jgi:hypothetical protein
MKVGMENLGESLFMVARLTFTDSCGFFVNLCIDLYVIPVGQSASDVFVCRLNLYSQLLLG